MKHFLLAALYALLVASHAFAQSPGIPEQLAFRYGPLDKSQLSTGYLWDLTTPLVSPYRYSSGPTTTNFISADIFGMLYAEMQGATTPYAATAMPNPAVFLDLKKSTTGTQDVPLAMLVWRYDQVRPDAFDLGLLQYAAGQVSDVPDRPIGPYFQDTLRAATLLNSRVVGLHPRFYLPENLFITNLVCAQPDISIDAGDGLGWRSLVPGQAIQVHYTATGIKEIRYQLKYADGYTWIGHSRLEVELPPVGDRDNMQWPRELYESIAVSSTKTFTDPDGVTAAGQATMHIFYNTNNCPGRMLRPLIIIEGFEQPGITTNSFDAMFKILESVDVTTGQNLTDYLQPNEYDLIYVDFANGNDWMQRNAYAVEEVLRIVNERKAAAGSTEQNVVIGVSMGGVVGKYALLDMATNDTRLFISYDAPLQGANVPIGTQCLLKYIKMNGPVYDQGGVSLDALDLAWAALQSPVARQLLIYHINAVTADNSEPINPEHVSFQAALNALGNLPMRHVALSNGAGTGTSIENSISAGATFFDAVGAPDENTVCKKIETYNPILNVVHTIILCAKIEFDIKVRATGNYTNTEVLNATLKVINPPPIQDVVSIWKPTFFTKPYDDAPGGASILGVFPLGSGPNGLLSALTSAGIVYSGPGLTASHHCYIPTFSSLDASEPAALYPLPQTCGTADRCSASTSATSQTYPNPAGGTAVTVSEINQTHIYLDSRIASVLVDELVTLSPPPYAHPFSINNTLSTYFNVGLPIQSLIPTVTVVSENGKLYINDAGLSGYATGNEPLAPLAHMDAYTKCNAIISVEKGASLIIGDENPDKDANLFVSEGSKVHIKAGGTLRIQRNSALILEKGSELILEEGAQVILTDQPGGSLQENGRPNIRVKANGKLNFKGNIVFSGDGYFAFDADNEVDFPASFSFTGSGKQYRHFLLNDEAVVHKAGGNLTIRNSKAQIGCAARFKTSDFNNLILQNCAFENIATCTPYLNGTQAAMQAENGVRMYALQCDFKALRCALKASKISSFARIEGGNFMNTLATNFDEVVYSILNQVKGEHASFWFERASSGVSMSNSMLEEGFDVGGQTFEEVVRLRDVKLFTMTGGIIDCQATSLNGIDGRVGSNNVYLKKGATIQNTLYGIRIEGGLNGYHDNTEYGLVRMDCARLLDCGLAGIKGQDVLLDIDAGVNSDGLRPNDFRNSDPFGLGSLFFDICYKFRNPSQVLANFNHWNQPGVAAGPPANQFILRKMSAGGIACSVNVPLVTNFNAVAYDPQCQYRMPRDIGYRDPMEEAYKICSLGDGLSFADYQQGWVAVDNDLEMAEQAETAPDYQIAVSLFDPFAAQNNQTLANAESACSFYTDVARIFTVPVFRDDRNNVSNVGSPIRVTPNPVAAESLVEWKGEGTLKVYDSFGRLIETYLGEDSRWLHTEQWTPGIYLLEVSFKSGRRETAKLIKY